MYIDCCMLDFVTEWGGGGFRKKFQKYEFSNDLVTKVEILFVVLR